MMSPETIRDFEKAPKSLIKMKGNEVLFKDEANGKMKFIYEAFEDENTLRDDAMLILQSDDGGKHLVRALNNFKSIPHQPAMRFARVVYETVRPQWDLLTHVQKCQQLLDAISDNFDGDSRWLDDETQSLLNTPELQNDLSASILLWSAWVGANLRSRPDADKLMNRQANWRPKLLSRPLFNQLVGTMNDPEERWEYRAAAMFALVGSGAMKSEDAQRFIDAAYTAFPLESLAGIETLSMAVEMDSVAFVEQNIIEQKLAQVRKEHLYLKEMKPDDFNKAALDLFSNQNNIPLEAVEVASQLASLDKNERMMATILIDDVRRAEYIQKAAKLQFLKPHAACFFTHFDPENPLCIALSQTLIMAVTEILNLNATIAENWLAACESGDKDSLHRLALQIVQEL